MQIHCTWKCKGTCPVSCFSVILHLCGSTVSVFKCGHVNPLSPSLWISVNQALNMLLHNFLKVWLKVLLHKVIFSCDLQCWQEHCVTSCIFVLSATDKAILSCNTSCRKGCCTQNSICHMSCKDSSLKLKNLILILRQTNFKIVIHVQGY